LTGPSIALADEVEEHLPPMPSILSQLLRNKAVLVGGSIFAVMVLVAVFANWLAPYDPNHMIISDRLKPPFFLEGGSFKHILGADQLGRDLLSRMMFGLRTSMIISLSAVSIASVLGIAIGLFSGYYGKLADIILMRLTDIKLGFPFIVLAIALLTVTTPNIYNITIVLALAGWPIYARVARGLVLSEKQRDYVRAATLLGASGPRIIFKYIAANVVPPILVVATLEVASYIIIEAVLAFLALGIQPPMVSWGSIMADGKNYLVNAWWVTTMPGVGIIVLLLGINLLADGLSEVIDPRGRLQKGG
ncbi:MAG: ABC transporter permease, partial [Chloroflexi bacterium]|nr:ABC transporter permease [Chloroflexota bacterium]